MIPSQTQAQNNYQNPSLTVHQLTVGYSRKYSLKKNRAIFLLPTCNKKKSIPTIDCLRMKFMKFKFLNSFIFRRTFFQLLFWLFNYKSHYWYTYRSVIPCSQFALLTFSRIYLFSRIRDITIEFFKFFFG